MKKGRTGMNEVSVYMDVCVRGWWEREKGELFTKLYISSLCIVFLTMCICIILIVNLPAE